MQKILFGFEVTRRASADGQIPLSFDSKAEALRYLARVIERDASALQERSPSSLSSMLAQHVKLRTR